jgi:hypothetical protein
VAYTPYPDEYWKLANNGSTSYASRDSFVRGSIEAGAQHQHLVISPDIVWLTILTQMNFYLRKHERDKDVRNNFENLPRAGPFNALMFGEPQKWWGNFILLGNRTDWLLDWIQPKFTTSNPADEIIADILVLASSIPLDEKVAPLTCGSGMPSITLLGTQKDWELLLLKLDRLKAFGEQPTRYSQNLRPILLRFFTTFKDPNNHDIRQFWSDMVTAKRKRCTTTNTVTGWINGFHYWNQAGDLLLEASGDNEGLGRVVLDDIVYPWRRTSDLPSAYYTFPLCWWADTLDYAKGEAVAGLLGTSIRKGAPEGYATAMRRAKSTPPLTFADSQHSSLQPMHAWDMNAELETIDTFKVMLYQYHGDICLAMPYS